MFGQESIPYEQLLGPYGLLVFLLLAVYILGRLMLRYVKTLEKDRDYWRDKSVDLLETSAAAVNAAVKLSPERDIEQMARVVDAARKRGEIR